MPYPYLTTHIRPAIVALLLAGACTWQQETVEPALPAGRIDGQPTVAYLRDGVPVVAHLYSNIGQLFTAFIPRFSGPPVSAELHTFSNTLSLQAADAQNEKFEGALAHHLSIDLENFRGAGTYTTSTGLAAVLYEEYQYDGRNWQLLHRYTGGSAPTQQVIVTSWDSVGHQLNGTFTLAVAKDNGLPVQLTQGRFSLKVQ